MITIKNPFLKNVLALMVGTVLAQIITVSIYPLITRMYSPENFGSLELFISIISILASVASLKYEQTIVIPKDDKDAYDLTKVSIIINIIFCTILFLIIAVFSNGISKWLDNPTIEDYLILVPVTVFFTAFFAAIRYLAIRKKQYKLISKTTTLRSIILSSLQLVMGVFRLGTFGLIMSQFFSAGFLNLSFYKRITKREDRNLFSLKVANGRLRKLMKDYIDFPKFAVIGTLANSLVLYGTTIFIFKMFSVETLGYLALANRLLSMPLSLISGAVGDVFLQKMAEERHLFGNAKQSFKKTFFPLFGISIFIALIGFLVLPTIFSFVFGENWRLSGYYASILIFLYALRFVNAPFSNLYVIFKRQGLSLMGTLIQLLILCILFWLTYYYKLTFESYLIYFVISQSCFYLIYLYGSWYIAKGEGK